MKPKTRLRPKPAYAAAAAFLACAIHPALAETSGAPFQARDVRTCPDKSQPASGPITPDYAKAYVICQNEYIGSGVLYLVYGINVQVGRGRPYQLSDQSYSEIDPEGTVYPIRGSMVTLSCDKVFDNLNNSGRNCRAYNSPNAKGACYRTLFGDWSCNMRDPVNDSTVYRYDVPAPR